MDTEALMAYALSHFAPLLVLAVGFAVLAKAVGGKTSAVAKMIVLTVIGVILLGGAGALVAWGDDLAGLAFKDSAPAKPGNKPGN